MPDAIVKAQRFDISTNTYKLQEVCTTNSEGQCQMSLSLDDEYYKFVVEYNSVVLLTTTPEILRKNTLVLQVVIGDGIAEEIFQYEDITKSLVFNETSGNWRLVYNDVNGLISSVTLKIYEVKASGNTLLNSSTLLTSSGTILIPMSVTNNTLYEAVAYYDNDNFLISETYTLLDAGIIGKKGLILQIFISLFFVIITLRRLEMIGISISISLLFGNLIGFIAIPYSAIWTILIIGFIVAWWVNRK